MISADIASKIRRQIGEHVAIEHRDSNLFDVSTPFIYADGDHYGFIVSRPASGGKWKFSDEGEVIDKARLAGADLLSAGRIERLKSALELYGLQESDGELLMTVGDGNFGEAFFQFT